MNRRCYGDEIANPRIEYGVAMTKWIRMSDRPAYHVSNCDTDFTLPRSRTFFKYQQLSAGLGSCVATVAGHTYNPG